jgi:endonuclease YncB( thermonuclease family)
MTEFHKPSIFNLQSSILLPLPFLILVLLSITANMASAQTWHRVKWVNDGDTIVLLTGQRVRYIGMNAPEVDHEDQKAEPYGYRARSMNRKLVGSGRIRLEYDAERRDRYGRTLAYVYLEDGTFVNARLLEAGLAFYLHRNPNFRFSKTLLGAQKDAMRSKRGLWRNWSEKERIYTGNRKSQRFHRVACKFARKINPGNRIQFTSKWNAFYHGYAPAKNCLAEYWSYEK